MAEFSEKLKVRLKNGTIQNVRIYSTAADIPPWQKPMRMRVGNIAAWVPTSPLGSPDASNLRLRHPGSSAIYVVNTIGRATYGNLFFVAPGAVSFTVPVGVRRLRVTCMGGGGAGAHKTGGNGEESTFAGVRAAGGNYHAGEGAPKNPTPPVGYYSTMVNVRGTGSSYSVGSVINYSWSGCSGIGAGGTGNHYKPNGYNGEHKQQIINVTPGEVLSGRVGKGAPEHTETSGMKAWQFGSAAVGGILLEWGGNIE